MGGGEGGGPNYAKPSLWLYLFPAINHNHLNYRETNQNLIHLFFPFCYTIKLTIFVI